jgi:predicted ATPase
LQTFVRVARGELNLERLPPLSPAAPSGDTTEPGPTASLHRFPEEPGPLLGREPEMAALERIFDDPQCRLLTLIGLGGIGKTRLAIEFAANQRSEFPDGVVYVPLASLSSPDLIVPAIAEVCGLAFSGPADPKEQLLNALSNRTRHGLLLVLDNLEHLLAPVSASGGKTDAVGLVKEILQRLPRVKILATSRERLNLHGEWMFELHGLPVPAQDYAGMLEDYGAAALFLLSARRLKADFELSPDDRPVLARICRQLDGIPLAVELAAGWVGMLSCREIAGEIEASMDFLTTSMRDVPERHRSIRATFDHTWRLLPAEECRALRRLAVFQGGFSRQAAEQVAGASLPILASLHARSLVRRADSGRYDLHEVIRQYVLAYFNDDAENLEIRDHQCEYYLGFLRDREKVLKSAAQQEAVQELAGEMDNVRAAWTWAIRCGKFEWIGQTLRSFSWLHHTAGWLMEGIEQVEPVVQALRSSAGDREQKRILGLALAQQGLLFFRKGQFDQAQSRYDESLTMLRSSGDPACLADPLLYSGILTHLKGDFGRAEGLIEESLACARKAGDRWFEAYALYNLGYIASMKGYYADGYEQMQAGLAMWRELGDPSSIALGLNYISPTAIQLGYLEEAQAYLHESLLLCMQAGDRWGTGTAYRNLGLASLAQGSPDEAQLFIRLSLDIFGEYIEGWDIARSLTYLGDAVWMAGDLPGAKGIYQEAIRSALEARAFPVALDALVGLARLHLCAGEFERAFELSGFVLDHPAGVQETRDRSKGLMMEAVEQLDEERIRAVRKKIAGQSLETILFLDGD